MTDATHTFRVHFDSGEPVDVTAKNPAEATVAARRRRQGIITKIKRLKQEAANAAR